MTLTKRFGRTAALVAVLVLLSSAVALAQVAWELTLGEAGGSFWSQAFSSQLVVEFGGEVTVAGGGGFASAPRAPEYDGMLDNGPARLTP